MLNLREMNHHAYVISGPKDLVVESLIQKLEGDFGINTKNNPDFRVVHFESMGIDESRMLKEMQSSKSLSAGGKRIFLVSTNAITVQAQNSMLKMFEEPAEGTHFFISVPTLSFFIETLLSRVAVLDFEGGVGSTKELDAKKFLKFTYAERLKVIEKFLKAYKDSKENKAMAQEFFSEIETLLSEDLKGNKDSLEKLLEIKKYIFDTSASLKILLETLALVLPCFK